MRTKRRVVAVWMLAWLFSLLAGQVVHARLHELARDTGHPDSCLVCQLYQQTAPPAPAGQAVLCSVPVYYPSHLLAWATIETPLHQTSPRPIGPRGPPTSL